MTRARCSRRSAGDLARGFYVENDLSSRQRSSAFQHHVGLSRIGEREDRTDACFQFTRIIKFGNSAQPLGGYFHQEEGCVDAVVLCAVLIRLGHGGDQFAAPAKNSGEPFRKSSLPAGRTRARAKPSSRREQGSVPRCRRGYLSSWPPHCHQASD